ncbi:flavodoxin [Candidatus Saccharibacteria bacterium]|nr:flavodoxin [Candidatus Saccharibacteria bacterium]
MKTLVVYYSAEGHTRKVAEEVSKNLGADLFEIVPDPIYEKADLDWTNPDSRVSKENDDLSLRENLKLKNLEVPNWAEYDRVILGYPIWYGIAAWPVNTFVKSKDWTNKTVFPFCTSHSSGLDNSDLLLKDDANAGDWQEGIRFYQDVPITKIKSWTDTL